MIHIRDCWAYLMACYQTRVSWSHDHCVFLLMNKKTTKLFGSTIAEEHSTATVPSVQDLLLQHNLGDQFLGCSINQASKRQNLPILAPRGS